MTTLLLSLLAIAVAPLLNAALRGRPGASAFADGLVQVVVGGILLVHVLPFGLATAGWPALVALAGGALLGVAAHRIPGGERSAGALAVVALLLHAGIDGAALGAPDDHGDHAGHAGEGLLAWAVVLHTVPVGLATWRITLAHAGTLAAAALLVATGLATTGGWFAADALLHGASPAALGLAQCAVAGALLHVLGHVGEGARRPTAGWGAFAGALLVAGLAATHPMPRAYIDELGAGAALGTLLLEASPALLLGYLVAGLLHVAYPGGFAAWLGGAGPAAAARGAVVGLAVPVCACAAVPTWRGLLARGASAAGGMAFLAAGPGVGVATLLVSVALLGPAFTATRFAATVAVAVLAGTVAARLSNGHTSRRVPPAEPDPRGPWLPRALRFGFVETVDHTAPWVLAGIGVAALVEPLLAPDALAAVPGPVAVLIAALIGVPAYVCAAGATPLLAMLLHKGVSTGAALAFLVTGPATNVVAIAALRNLEGKKTARAFVVALAMGAVAVGIGVDQLPPVPLPDLHLAADHAHTAVEWVAAVVIVALFAAALVRNGAPGFLEPLMHPHGHEDDADGHGHGHSHSHAHSHGHAGKATVNAALSATRPTYTFGGARPLGFVVGAAPMPGARAAHDGAAHDHAAHAGHDHDHAAHAGHDHDHAGHHHDHHSPPPKRGGG